MKPMSFGTWLSLVKSLLVHPDAIECTAAWDEASKRKIFHGWYELPKSPKHVADELNRRYRTGYFERKEEIREEKKDE